MVAYCIDETKLEYGDGKKYPDTENPDKFSHSKWVAWEEMVYTYFTATKKIRGLTLSYFIHKILDPSGIFIDREQEIMQNYPLQGNMFYCDTKKVLAILKEIKFDTDAETWMKGKICGQEEMLLLQNHYDGKSEGELRKQVAKDYLNRLFYRK